MHSAKLQLEISKKQAQIISKACELFARLQLGQLREILCLLGKQYGKNKEAADQAILSLKLALFPELFPYGYHSLRSPEISDNARVAYDIHQVIRHHLSGPQPEEGFPLVYHDEPRPTSEEEPLPGIKTIASKENGIRSKADEALSQIQTEEHF